jgi:hypothetical protein
VVLARSTNLVDWAGAASTTWWFPATNTQEFYRVSEVTIKRAARVASQR